MCKEDENEIYQQCKERLITAKEWANTFYEPLANKNITATALTGTGRDGNASAGPEIRTLIGNEQNVNSHKFGFKGKLDGLIRVDMPLVADANTGNYSSAYNHQALSSSSGGEMVTKTTSLEIKTGKQRTEHIGQITVYYMLLCDLVNQQMDKGRVSDTALLLYPHANKYIYDPKKISKHDMRGVITRRNVLAATIQRRRQTLEEGALRGPIYPPKLDGGGGGREHYQCRYCFSKNACYTVSTALENGQELPMMPAETRAYVQKWLMVIDAEDILGARDKERPWQTSSVLQRLS